MQIQEFSYEFGTFRDIYCVTHNLLSTHLQRGSEIWTRLNVKCWLQNSPDKKVRFLKGQILHQKFSIQMYSEFKC